MQGYIASCLSGQSVEKQKNELIELGCKIIYKEDIALAPPINLRTSLKALIKNTKTGDCIVVSELSVLSANTTELTNILSSILNRGVNIKSIKEEIDTCKDINRLVYKIITAYKDIQNKEKNTKREKSPRVGRKRGLSSAAEKKALLAKELYDTGKNVSEISKIIKTTKATCYRYLYLLEEQQKNNEDS